MRIERAVSVGNVIKQSVIKDDYTINLLKQLAPEKVAYL